MEEGSVPTVDKFIRLQAHVFQLIVHKLEIARGLAAHGHCVGIYRPCLVSSRYSRYKKNLSCMEH